MPLTRLRPLTWLPASWPRVLTDCESVLAQHRNEHRHSGDEADQQRSIVGIYRGRIRSFGAVCARRWGQQAELVAPTRDVQGELSRRVLRPAGIRRKRGL